MPRQAQRRAQQETQVREPVPARAPGLDDLLTPPAVAALLGVSPPTVYSVLHRGGLDHLRTPGGQIRVRRRAVLAFCHRSGVPVPAGLIPHSPQVVALHPEGRNATRLRRCLDGSCHVQLFGDPVDMLLATGRLAPPLVIVSERVGAPLLERITSAITGAPADSYAALLVLVSGGASPWQGGALPTPLRVPETAGRELGDLVAMLLGRG